MLFRGGKEKDIRNGIIRDDRLEAVIGLAPNLSDSHDQPWVDWYTSASDVVAALKGDAGALRQAVAGFVETDTTSSAAIRHQTSSLDLPEIS